MNINLKIKLPEPAKTKKASASPSARLPGEKAPFKEMGVRNLVPQQSFDGLRIGSCRTHEVRREPSVDEKFQEFLAGEARQRKELNLRLRGQEYRAQFLINCMNAE
jgi:hypothetical protein